MAGVLDAVHVGLVVTLDEPDAQDPTLSGAKAASLAVAAGQGLPVVPGFVVTTRAHERYLVAGRALSSDVTAPLHRAWEALTEDGQVPVAVRSSSTVEDSAASSMAGRFRSVLDVRGWEAFLEAVGVVYASADKVAGGEPSPMGVLVQRHLSPVRSGVLFGIDPVTGDSSHIVVEAVSGGPDKLVSGQVAAQHYVVARSGRLRALDHRPLHALTGLHHGRRLLTTGDLLGLARLARRTQKVFGAPQDVEWAIDARAALVLLQSRPVTAAAGRGRGPVLGPGPLAETFPDPLGELEVDLWIRPLRAAVAEAMTDTAAVSSRRLRGSPVVTVVKGRVAADLELFGYVPRTSGLRWLDPRPPLRQLRAAWRRGVLRTELAERAAETMAEVDASLSAVDPTVAGEGDLLDLLQDGTDMLRRLHHAEVLAGTLLPTPRATAPALALQVLAAAEPVASEAELVRRHPVLLCLVPPSVAEDFVLPPVPRAVPKSAGEPLGEREQLRLRARWVQEMTVRVACELGRRLARRGLLDEPRDVGLLQLDELRTLATTGDLPGEPLASRRARDLSLAFEPALPVQFRLDPDGHVVPATPSGKHPGAGAPAGGGRGAGPVSHGSVRRPPVPGDVLVVRDLQPGVAAWLPDLAGLVAETGGTLSHLAILAREYGVPTVVAVHDAMHRFPPGSRVLVDGATGEVRVLDREEEP